jgi:undecaprenyl-diphosphatase
MQALTHAGDTESWFLQGAVLTAVHERSGLLFSVIACSTLLATGVAQVLKRLWRRPRPVVAIEGFEAACAVPDCFSFPSGHTAVAFSVAFATQGFGTLGSVELALALGIASSRVYLGAHYPLDVVAGAVVGIVTGTLTRLLLGV